MEFGIIIAVIIAIIVVAFIWYNVATSYNVKVAEALHAFILAAVPYKMLVGIRFVVETNNKKIKTWDEEHTKDYIINSNIRQIVEALELFNDLEVWWQGSMPKVREAVLSRMRFLASNMMLFGNRFTYRVTIDLERLVSTYNPKTMKFSLKTYTHHSNTTHYNPNTGNWWGDASPDKTTFSAMLSPSELLARIDILAKYGFQMTEYQYKCEDQRKLMTIELRQKIIERDKGICQHCKKKCLPGDLEIDHIQPVSKGGKTLASNLQVLCMRCNRTKSNKFLGEIKDEYGSHLFSFEGEKFRPIIEKVVTQTPKPATKSIPQVVKVLYGNGVKVGKFVKIHYMGDNMEESYQIVESWDADSNYKCISASSPIGSALLGNRENDIVVATTPSGKVKMRIMKISEKEIDGE